MKRVASLYLPHWSIDRLRRNECRSALSADAAAAPSPASSLEHGFAAIGAQAAAERAQQCSVPKEGGWRPGARWARTGRDDVEAAVAALPAHRRPPQRELGRTSEAADHPFRADIVENRGTPAAPLRELSRRTEAASPLFKPGARGWSGEDVDAAIISLPAHQRPSFQELSRRSEVMANPFRPMPPDEGGFGPMLPPVMPPVQFPGEDVSVRRAMRGRRRSARDGHGGEAGYIAPPTLAQLAAMPSVQFPGEGPHPDNHGKSAPSAPTYGQGRFFQTGRTLGSVVARVCRDETRARVRMTGEAAEAPLVTTQKVGPRVEVVAVNPAARALGLQSGMALTMARAQVPNLKVRAADPEGDAAELRAFAERLARRWAPNVAVSDPQGLIVELTGVAHLHGGETRFAQRLMRLLERYGIAAQVAVADSAGAAWALARYGEGGPIRIVAPGRAMEALAPLPVAALRVEPAAIELLARLGVDTVRQLVAMPRAPLVRRFGARIVERLDQAAGRVPEPLDPVVPPERIVVEQRFAEPIGTAEAIEHWLARLMPCLARALAEAGQGARGVELVAARVDGVPQHLRLGFARPTRDAAHMLRLAVRRIAEIEPGYGIDALALHVRRADPLAAEAIGTDLAADDKASDLGPLIDTLANRIGSHRLWRMAPVESDVPERSLVPMPPLDPPSAKGAALKRDDVRWLDARLADHPWHARWPRPVRLLRHPEAVDHVLAELPDNPPKRFTWRGQTHRVVRAEGPERIAGEWWRRSAERQAVRDYYRVEIEDGRRFWLYRRGDGVRDVTGDLTWYLHGRAG